jgi:hypothetical protein
MVTVPLVAPRGRARVGVGAHVVGEPCGEVDSGGNIDGDTHVVTSTGGRRTTIGGRCGRAEYNDSWRVTELFWEEENLHGWGNIYSAQTYQRQF